MLSFYMWKNDLFRPEEALKVDSRSETNWKILPQTRISDSPIQLHLHSPGNFVSLKVFCRFLANFVPQWPINGSYVSHFTSNLRKRSRRSRARDRKLGGDASIGGES